MAQIKTIGVVGAGQMGNGIAHVAALAGYDVFLNDISQEKLDAGRTLIERNLTRQAARGLIKDAEIAPAMARIVTTTAIEDLSAIDLAIEAASEKEDIKRAIFKSLCAVVRPDTILASNTSSLSITRLGSSTDRPERFIGLHFMNPVPMMKLVEVIRGLATNEETYEAATKVVTAMGKTITNAEDFPAFIVNRVLIPMINEAVYTLYEGVGTVEGIDSIDRRSFQVSVHPLGIL